MNQSQLTRNLYSILSALLSCPVTRAWPQQDAAAPSAAFRLKGYRHLEDGADEAVIQLMLRADTPAAADALADEVLSGIGAYGYFPAYAEDGVEEVTGAFLHTMELTARLYGDTPNALRFGVGAAPVNYLSGLFAITQRDAVAPAYFRSSLSGLVTGALRGRPGRAAYTVSQAYLAGDPAQTAIQAAFESGAALPCETYHTLPDRQQFTALVTAFSRSVLGFSCELTRTG